MDISCSAVITNDRERERIREQVCRRYASSYGDHADSKKLYCTYSGSDRRVINMLIETFEKYPEHVITQNR